MDNSTLYMLPPLYSKASADLIECMRCGVGTTAPLFSFFPSYFIHAYYSAHAHIATIYPWALGINAIYTAPTVQAEIKRPAAEWPFWRQLGIRVGAGSLGKGFPNGNQ